MAIPLIPLALGAAAVYGAYKWFTGDEEEDSPQQETPRKPSDQLEEQRIYAINEKKDAIYQIWFKTIVDRTTETYKLNRTSDTITNPPELLRLRGPEIDYREIESVIKKAAHDAFDSLDLKVGEKVKFQALSEVGGLQKITIYLEY